MYNINNIVIPMSAAKVEKLQYKDILTPRYETKLPVREMNRIPQVLVLHSMLAHEFLTNPMAS